MAAYAFNPDMAIAVDSTPAYDLPVWDESENAFYNTRLDAGPAIYISDAGTLSDPRLVRHLAETGDALGIPYQFRQPGGGGTDAGAIHRQRVRHPQCVRFHSGSLRSYGGAVMPPGGLAKHAGAAVRRPGQAQSGHPQAVGLKITFLGVKNVR